MQICWQDDSQIVTLILRFKKDTVYILKFRLGDYWGQDCGILNGSYRPAPYIAQLQHWNDWPATQEKICCTHTQTLVHHWQATPPANWVKGFAEDFRKEAKMAICLWQCDKKRKQKGQVTPEITIPPTKRDNWWHIKKNMRNSLKNVHYNKNLSQS